MTTEVVPSPTSLSCSSASSTRTCRLIPQTQNALLVQRLPEADDLMAKLAIVHFMPPPSMIEAQEVVGCRLMIDLQKIVHQEMILLCKVSLLN